MQEKNTDILQRVFLRLSLRLGKFLKVSERLQPKIMKTKQSYERATRASVSMPPTLHQFAVRQQQDKGLATFSDYIQELIRREKEAAEEREIAA